MRKVQKIAELKGILETTRKQHFSIGLVPTMGALHEGHFALLRQCKRENDFTIATIFVNPLQFNDSEDYDNYPRRKEEDLRDLEMRGCDMVFSPSREEIYPEGAIIGIDFGEMEQVLEGRYRPGHFQGVGVVLAKFFNLLRPNKAYFGLKDLQQYLLVRRLAQDLFFDLEVVGVPTVREASGLAMSSRNLRLTDRGKETAAHLSKGLRVSRVKINEKHPPSEIVKGLREFYEQVEGLTLEYVEIVNASNLQRLDSYEGVTDLAVCVAGYVEEVRLIDNLYLHLDATEK